MSDIILQRSVNCECVAGMTDEPTDTRRCRCKARNYYMVLS